VVVVVVLLEEGDKVVSVLFEAVLEGEEEVPETRKLLLVAEVIVGGKVEFEGKAAELSEEAP